MGNYKTKNIKMVAGDTVSFGFEIKGVTNLDTAFFSCKRNYQDEYYVFQKQLGNGITAGEDGKYIVRIAPEDTESLSAGMYCYDLEVGVNNDVYTILRGDFEIVSEITSNSTIVYSSVDWGNITGNITSQTDLQTALNAKADTTSLAQVAITGAYSDLSSKPTIPTKTSQLTNDAGFVLSSALASVATSGSYSDLTGKPTSLLDFSGNLPVTRLSGTLQFAGGGTGGTTAVEARTNLELMKEYVLIDQDVSSGSIVTLNDSIMNYRKIGICSYDPYFPQYRGYQEFYIVSDLTFYKITAFVIILTERSIVSRDSYLGFRTARLRFEETSMEYEEPKTFNIETSGTTTNADDLIVHKIVGYKY